MNMPSFLPQRWRAAEGARRQNEAIAEILSTPPIRPRHDGLVLFATVGSMQLLPFLLAVKSLWHRLGRGRLVVIDDGTLLAQDRTVLTQHCGDPQILRPRCGAAGGFPPGPAWTELLTMLDGRSGEYWLRVGPETVTLGEVTEIARALGTNRSFALLSRQPGPEAPLPLRQFVCQAFPTGPVERGRLSQMESRLAELSGVPAWHYLRACPGLGGFAAGNAGRELAAAFRARLADLLGEEMASSSQAARVTANFILANEAKPICLPRQRYCDYAGLPVGNDAAVVRFGAGKGDDDGAWSAASARAIATLRT